MKYFRMRLKRPSHQMSFAQLLASIQFTINRYNLQPPLTSVLATNPSGIQLNNVENVCSSHCKRIKLQFNIET